MEKISHIILLPSVPIDFPYLCFSGFVLLSVNMHTHFSRCNQCVLYPVDQKQQLICFPSLYIIAQMSPYSYVIFDSQFK